MRGLATEFGLTASKGIWNLEDLMMLVDANAALHVKARQSAKALFDQSLRRWKKEFRHSKPKSLRMPGITTLRDGWLRSRESGQLPQSLIAATVADIGVFKSARHFAAWLGLIPRRHSTGGRTRLGRITKTGNREIRKLLVLGATSMVHRAQKWNSTVGAWIRSVLQRRPVRLATVALANKNARIAWALMTRSEVYLARGHITTVAKALS